MDQFARERLEHLEGKVRRLEQTLASVLDHLGLAGRDDSLEPVRDLLRQGKKAEAVVFYHRDKGVGLGEATAAVEEIAREL